jgi:hypothetical protein
VAEDSGLPDDSFPLKLYSRYHVSDLLRSHGVAVFQGPATENRWFAERLGDIQASRIHLGAWKRFLLEFKSTTVAESWVSLRPHLRPARPLIGSTELAVDRHESDSVTVVPDPSPTPEPRHQRSGSELSGASRDVASDVDEALDPVRERLSELADEVIHGVWNNGDLVNLNNSSAFAMGVLVAVRTKILGPDGHLMELGLTGSEPQSSSLKLTLRHMKFVYDLKIKPIAEKFQKKLFRCNATDCRTKRPYDLEGAMMHVSKHSSEFASGAKKVDWDSSEWPRTLPFADATSLRPDSRQQMMSPIDGHRRRTPGLYPPPLAYPPFPPPSIPTGFQLDPAQLEEEDDNSRLNRFRRLEKARRDIAVQDAMIRREQESILRGDSGPHAYAPQSSFPLQSTGNWPHLSPDHATATPPPPADPLTQHRQWPHPPLPPSPFHHTQPAQAQHPLTPPVMTPNLPPPPPGVHGFHVGPPPYATPGHPFGSGR